MTGRSEALAFLEIIRLVDLVQDERSKCLHIVLVFTAPRLSSRLLHYAETKLHSDSMKFIEV